ncbi:transglycosylase SLT domain-containing protein [Cuneatibacter caecimuris]|uniref:Transglycosylase-like protein with SLT domain n=1 Tax=Cuneatibacter caecimuris TaxID=1796618 RepID=A0A4Q7PUD7_9FIRM|nr:transglycosylase SLT domain-containing protein [Cuneatibacter caecimuris]RZT02930.1 transglycosylase-like protein with SLT domain [Cuneatibacter caecimuris]
MQRLNKYILAGALALVAEIALFAVLPIPEPQEAPITHAARTEAPTEPITAKATEIPVETVKAAYIATETATETPTEPETMPPERYDIPLPEDLQDYLIATAHSYGLDPALVIAVIWRESCYQADAVGDAGQAIGLMQIQPRWHQERMRRLGVTDLADPRSNILVGCDILAEVIGQYGVTGGLTYYRWGRSEGDGAYAAEVLAYAGTMEGGESR